MDETVDDKNETAVIRCTVCGDTYPLEGVTYDELRAEGIRSRKIHGERGVPGLCPEHAPDDDGWY